MCPLPLVLKGGPPRMMPAGPEEDLVKLGGGQQGQEDRGAVWGGRQDDDDYYFFNSEKQLFCIFVFYVSSCRSFSFFLMIKKFYMLLRGKTFLASPRK